MTDGLYSTLTETVISKSRCRIPINVGVADLTFIVSGVDTLGGQMPVLIVHKAAIGISQQELRPGDGIAGNLVFLLDNQRSSRFVPEGQLLDVSGLDLDVLRGSVKDIALDSLNLTGNDHGAGFDTCQDDLAGLIGIVEAIVRADSSASAVHYPEGYAGQRLVLRTLDKLADDQRRGGGVVEVDGLGVVGLTTRVCVRVLGSMR